MRFGINQGGKMGNVSVISEVRSVHGTQDMLTRLSRVVNVRGNGWQEHPDEPGIYEAWCDITYAGAGALLRDHCNVRNRRPKAWHVTAMAADIRSGAWKYIADPIIFNDQGQVIDGQHRLMACAKSGAVMRSVRVVVGMPGDRMHYIDTGRAKRSGADAMKIAFDKTTSTSVYSAVIQESYGNGGKRADIPAHKLIEVVAACEFTGSLERIRNAARSGAGCPTGFLSGVLACMKVNHDEAAEFFMCVAQNKQEFGGRHWECMRLLANTLMQNKGSTGNTRWETHMKTIRAWNAYRTREDLAVLKTPRAAIEPV